MAIESISGNPLNRALSAKSVAKDVTEAKQTVGLSASADILNITSTSHDIKTAAESGLASPAINEERVAAISAAIQNGSYHIDAGRVANKLLEFDSRLPNTT